jgi:hypothetical protein
MAVATRGRYYPRRADDGIAEPTLDAEGDPVRRRTTATSATCPTSVPTWPPAGRTTRWSAHCARARTRPATTCARPADDPLNPVPGGRTGPAGRPGTGNACGSLPTPIAPLCAPMYALVDVG